MKDHVELETRNWVNGGDANSSLSDYNKANVENNAVLDVTSNITSQNVETSGVQRGAALAELVALWETKNAKRAAKGLGLSSLAISLAACGGGGGGGTSSASAPAVATLPDADGDGVPDIDDIAPNGEFMISLQSSGDTGGLDNITGTAGADLFYGAAAGAFASGDNLKGEGGADRLFALVSDDATVLPFLTSIETVTIKPVVTSSSDTLVLDLSESTGVTSVVLENVEAASSEANTFVLRGVSTGVTLTVNDNIRAVDVSGTRGTDFDNNATVIYDGVNGESDQATVIVNTNHLDLDYGTVTVANIETLTVNVTGGWDIDYAVLAADATTLILNVAADATAETSGTTDATNSNINVRAANATTITLDANNDVTLTDDTTPAADLRTVNVDVASGSTVYVNQLSPTVTATSDTFTVDVDGAGSVIFNAEDTNFGSQTDSNADAIVYNGAGHSGTATIDLTSVVGSGAPRTLSITGGTGSDTVKTLAGSFDEYDTVALGGGTDVIEVIVSAANSAGTTVSNTLYNASNTAPTISGVDSVKVSLTDGGSVLTNGVAEGDITIDAKSVFATTSVLNITSDGVVDLNTFDIVVNNLAANSTVNFGDFMADDNSAKYKVAIETDTASDAVTIGVDVNNDSSGSGEVDEIEAAGFETVTVVLSDAAGDVTTATVTEIDVDDATTVNLQSSIATSKFTVMGKTTGVTINATQLTGTNELTKAEAATHTYNLGNATNTVILGDYGANTTVVGTSGTDTVTLNEVATTADAPTITGVDAVEYTADTSTGGGLNAAGFTNVGKLVIKHGSTTDSDSNSASVTNLTASQVVEINSTNDAGFDGDTITLNVATGVSSLEAVRLTGTQSFGADSADISAAGKIVTNATSLAVHNAAVTSSGDAVDNAFMIDAPSVTTLTLSGAGGLTVTADTSQNALETVSATAHTGNLTLTDSDLFAATGATVTTGTASTTTTVLGSMLTNGDLHLVDNGGTDVMSASETTGADFGRINVDGFETLKFQFNLGTAQTIGFSDASGYETIEIVEGDQTTDLDESITLDSVASGTTLRVGGSYGGGSHTLTVNAATGGASDTLTIASSASKDFVSSHANAAVTTTGFETVNLIGGGASGGTAYDIDLLNTNKDALLTLTGATALNLGSADANALGEVKLGTVSATSVESLTLNTTNGLISVANLGTMNSLETLSVTTAASKKATITNGSTSSLDAITGSGDGDFEITAMTAGSLDSITWAGGGALTVTEITGSELDTVSAGSATGIVTLGNGATAALSTASVASITTGTKSDSVALSVDGLTGLTLNMGTNTAGNGDTLYLHGAQASGTAVINLGLTDQITQWDGQANAASQTGIENVDLSQVTANGAIVTGVAGTTSLVGSAAADTLDARASTGAVTLNGQAGNDTLYGSSTVSSTFIASGTSNDASDKFVGGSGTSDTIQITATTNFADTNANITGIENVTITASGSVNVDLTGQTENFIITGGAGNNSITGGSGDDTINLGSSGGTDTVVIAYTNNGTDTVNDFAIGSGGDVIDLAATLSDLHGTGAVAKVLGSGGSVGTNDGLIIYNADVADISTIELVAEGLVGEADIFYMLTSKDYDEAADVYLWKITITGANDSASEENVAIFKGVDLGELHADNLADYSAIST